MKSSAYKAIQWRGGLDGHAELIDQTLLPNELKILEIRNVPAMWEAIQSLRVRGAPAIGIAAAMGVVIGVGDYEGDIDGLMAKVGETCKHLATSRPTAVNLFWALDRMKAVAASKMDCGVQAVRDALLSEAKDIRDEDARMCRSIGEHGAALIGAGAGVLTHCNAGWLATSEYGTALAPMYVAHERGRSFRVYADETRPLLQGARLTAWELSQAQIDVTLICDNAAGQVLKEGKVDLVITGADRIAANGDTANKIGTYGLAVMAKAHGTPFYVAAPSSTFDFSSPDGQSIPIEQRSGQEVRAGFGAPTAPEGIAVYNPAFDVTPADHIAGIVTEAGIISPVDNGQIQDFFTTKGLKNPRPTVEFAF
jgi:methylthioribose-1-phosphate isomerase